MQKKILKLTLILIFCVSTTQAEKLSRTNDSINTSNGAAYILSDSIINYSKSYLNSPYRSGSSSEKGFDCSGFTSFVYRNFGYNLPRSSSSQAASLSNIEKKQLLPGDLVFFEGRRRNGRVGHVGIVTESKEDGTFEFIHASTNSGVIITNSEADYYAKRYVKAGRVVGNPYEYIFDTAPRSEYNTLANNPKAEVKNAKQTTKYHVVKSGETLSSIAKENNTSIAALKSKNGLKNSKLRPGQRLKVGESEMLLADNSSKKTEQKNVEKDIAIVATPANKSMEQKKATAESKRSDNNKTYTVRGGESLYKIAKDNNLTVEQLKQMNELSSNDIKSGQVLVVAKAELSSLVDKVVEQLQHIVKKGETIYSISKNYGCSVDNLKNWNNKNGNDLRVGESLIVFPKTI